MQPIENQQVPLKKPAERQNNNDKHNNAASKPKNKPATSSLEPATVWHRRSHFSKQENVVVVSLCVLCVCCVFKFKISSVLLDTLPWDSAHPYKVHFFVENCSLTARRCLLAARHCPSLAVPQRNAAHHHLCRLFCVGDSTVRRHPNTQPTCAPPPPDTRSPTSVPQHGRRCILYNNNVVLTTQRYY